MDWIVYGWDWEFTSEDGPPEDAPGLGVLIISQRDPLVGREAVGRPPEVIHGAASPSAVHAFWYEAGSWSAGDYVSYLTYLSRPGKKIIKMAATVPNAVFRDALHRANRDPRMWPKSGRYSQEPT